MVTKLALEDSTRGGLVEAFTQLLGSPVCAQCSPHSQITCAITTTRSTSTYSRTWRALPCPRLSRTGCCVAQAAAVCGPRGGGDGAQPRYGRHDLRRRSSVVATTHGGPQSESLSPHPQGSCHPHSDVA
eukprot:scaffold52959_cov59-Phaeocystis_antarctica.AAC.5